MFGAKFSPERLVATNDLSKLIMTFLLPMPGMRSKFATTITYRKIDIIVKRWRWYANEVRMRVLNIGRHYASWQHSYRNLTTRNGEMKIPIDVAANQFS